MIRKFITILCVALLAATQLNAQGTNYSATFETTGSGHVSLNKWSTITAGETLRLFLLPSENWELQSVKVVLASDETTELELTDYYDKNYIAYTFVAPEDNIIVRATFVHVFYNVTINQPDAGGTIEVDSIKARQGEEVHVIVHPEIEYTTSWVYVNRDDTGTGVYTYKVNNNHYFFKMPNSDVIITAGFTAKERYNIALGASEHGVTEVKSSGVQGETIIVTVTPDAGYEVDHVWAYKTEAIGGGLHYEPLDVTHIDDTHSSFVMPAAYTTVGTDFKKRLYPVHVLSGTDMAEFRLFSDAEGFEGGSWTGLFIYPNQSDYTIAKLTLTDEDDNELDYTVYTGTSSGKRYFEVQFMMPNSPVYVNATIKAPHVCPIELVAEGQGQAEADMETACPGETVTITVTPEKDCAARVPTVVVGYDVSGGSGGAHAPSRAESLWYDQEVLEVTRVDATHFQFTLPQQLSSELTPNYLDDSRIKVQVEFVYVGPQVIYCDDNATLYFHYSPTPEILEAGDSYNSRIINKIWNGQIVAKTGWTTPGWAGGNWIGSINVKTVVIEDDFAQLRPTSCYAWFYNFSSLEEIVGLENLNTSSVTNMNSMFCACRSLTTLDLNSFDMRKVTNATSMFRSCSELTTIYCDSTWNISTTQTMFLATSKLLGAVAYDSEHIEGDMANPHTGYFTGKWAVNIPSQFDHGSVTCEKLMAYTNETVTLQVSPDNGYELETLSITTVDNEPSGAPLRLRTALIDYSTDENDAVTFVMPPAPVTVNATFKEKVPTAVEEINAPRQGNGQRYDLHGRPVGRDYRGIVIENGVKRVVK